MRNAFSVLLRLSSASLSSLFLLHSASYGEEVETDASTPSSASLPRQGGGEQVAADTTSPAASGGESGSPGGPGGPPVGVPRGPIEFFDVEVSGLWLPESGVRGVGGGGDLAEKRMAAVLGWRQLVSANHFSLAELTYTYRDYDLTGDSLYAGSFDRVNALRLQTTFERPFHDRWSAFLWSGLSVQAAEGADLLDGWNVPFAGGIGYKFSEKLVVAAGVLGILEAETGGRVIPLVALRWRPNDRFTLMTLNGARATYKLGEQREWTVLGSVLYQTFVFAVDDLEGFERTRGVVSQEYWLARLGLLRSFGPAFEAGVYLENRFNRKFEYIDDDREFAGFDVDAATGLRLSATYRF